jgi:SAM-dependent methyltransferase
LVVGEVTEQWKEELWSGTLACEACRASFAVRRGMALVHREDDSWSSKAREAAGWVALHKHQGNYEPGEEQIDLQIPYYPQEPWIGVARSFDAALQRLQLQGGEIALDLGAGRGWAAKRFALLGCEVVALDVTADEHVGLGRGRALMDNAGIYFERVIGDGENLPFQPQTFDLVFCSAALHHATDLGLLLQNVAKVLKCGGRLCAILEPSLSVLDDEAEWLARAASEEAAVGINETRPTYEAYLRALRDAGLQPVEVVPAPSLHMSEADMQAWAQDLGAVWAAPDWRNPKRTARRLWAFGTKRLRAILRGRAWQPVIAERSDVPQAVLEAVATWCMGELFVLAEREGEWETGE